MSHIGPIALHFHGKTTKMRAACGAAPAWKNTVRTNPPGHHSCSPWIIEIACIYIAGHEPVFCVSGFSGLAGLPRNGIEIVGGALLVLGLYSRQVALLAIPVMLGAAYVHLENGLVFSNSNGGWEFPAFLTIAAIVVVLQDSSEFGLRKLLRKI